MSVRRVERDVVIGEEIDVDGARAPSLLPRAVAAKRAFDLSSARSKSCGDSEVSTAMTALTKGGWSVTPHGGVR